LGTAVDDGGLLVELGSTALRAAALDGLDYIHRLPVSHLAEDDVAVVQPGGHHGGDEELRAIGVGSSVGHREQTRSIVLQFKVLIRKLVTVDGLASGSIATGEVATLEHEVGNDSVERGALVSESILAGAELFEIFRGLRDNLVVEVEVDATLVYLSSRTLPLHVEPSSRRHFWIRRRSLG